MGARGKGQRTFPRSEEATVPVPTGLKEVVEYRGVFYALW